MRDGPANKPETRPAFTRIHIDESHAPSIFAASLKRHVQHLPAGRPVLLICIGSDRSTGDSLGPLVGSRVQDFEQDFFRVYGTLDQPVHAANLQETLDAIRLEYDNPFIIAVDACLGRAENVGCVNICEGALKPGAGVQKNLPPVGDIHITGVVNVGGFMEFMILQNTRLNVVMRLAEMVCAGLKQLILEYQKTPVGLEPAAPEPRISGTQAI
ncbi:MAG: spore protease YyaC [Candidatus Desulforudis sp.]|nr:spore protease YyaC [Desulforudis sp.]